MLQQTQVQTVIPYFERFLHKFPSIEELSHADESEVLKLWEGLGYYRRARQLHAAARLIVEKYRGEFPIDYDSVLKLPGIGRYTAGAILSIALQQRLPILEGNTMRVYSRLLALPSDPRLPENQRRLWDFAESILPKQRAGDFNQALMELGSQVCTPKSPACDQCPLKKLCPTNQHGLHEKIPAAGKKVNYESIEEALIIILRRKNFLVRLCQPGERWAGLWDFPRYRLDNSSAFEPGNPTSREDSRALKGLESEVQRTTGLQVSLKSNGWQVRHFVTRFRITLFGFQAVQVKGPLRADRSATVQPHLRWVSLEMLHSLPMSVTARKLVAKLQAADQ
jgi:A/G-specific adenine glycosylase